MPKRRASMKKGLEAAELIVVITQSVPQNELDTSLVWTVLIMLCDQ